MLRFQIIDCFGDAIRVFNTMAEAKAFKRNKPDCRINEVSIFDVVEECLF